MHRLERRYPILKSVYVRFAFGFLAFTVIFPSLYLIASNTILKTIYKLRPNELALITETTVDKSLIKVTEDAYTYNRSDEDIKDPGLKLAIASKKDATGKIPYQVSLSKNPSKGITFGDKDGARTITLIPNFSLVEIQEQDGHYIYPASSNEMHVYTLRKNGIKSDIIIEKQPKENVKQYVYDIKLSNGLEIRNTPNGGIGVYSADSVLYDNISISDDKSKALVDKARTNGEKTNLAFELPQPFILTKDNKKNYEDVDYKLKTINNTTQLILTARNLKNQTYPLSIDPTLTVTTTADFQSYNADDGNIDYSTSGQITRNVVGSGGGGVGSWSAVTSLQNQRSYQATVAYNGYLYNLGGCSGYTGSVCNGYYSTVEYTSISGGTLGTMSYTTSLPTARLGHDAMAYNGYMYISGGYNGSNLSDVRYALICTGSNSGVGGCSATAGTLGTWSSTTAFTTARWGHSMVGYNGYMYIMAGNNGAFGTTTGAMGDVLYASIKADGSLGSWSSTTSMGTIRYGLTGTTYNGYIYVFGGYNATNGYLNSVEYAQINSTGTVGTWSTTTAMPVTRYSSGIGVYNGYIYAIGGNTAGGYGTVTNYASFNSDGTIGNWARIIDYSTAREGNDGVAYNGYLFMAAGRTGTSTHASDIQSIVIGDGRLDSEYKTGTALTNNGRYGQGAVAYNGYLYMIGGYNTTTGFLNTVHYATINSTTGALGTWTTNANNLLTARVHHTSVVSNGYIYAISGQTGAGWSTTVEYAQINTSNGSVGTWATTTALATARKAAASTVFNGYVYVTGGCTTSNECPGTGTLNTVVYAQQSSTGTLGTWSTSANTFTTARFAHETLVYNGYLYIMGGCPNSSNGLDCTSVLSDVQYALIDKSNGNIGSFSSAGSLISARRYFAAVVSNGYLYISGGTSSATWLGSTLMYVAPFTSSGSIGTWASTTSMSTGRHAHRMVGYNGFLYNVGGYDTGAVTTSEYIRSGPPEGRTGTATVQATMFTGRYAHTSVAYNGYLYIIGGWTSAGASNTIYYCKLLASGAVDTCFTTTSFTTARLFHASAIYNGYLYIVGGTTGGVEINDITYCKINTTNGYGIDSCTAQASKMFIGYSYLSASAYNGYLYIITGWDGANSLTPGDIYYCQILVTNDSTNGSTPSCTRLTSIILGRQSPSSVAYNGYLYIMGGTGASYYNDIYSCPLNADGSLGTCIRQTNAFTVPRFGQSSVAYDGYLYIMGGEHATTDQLCNSGTNSVYCSDVQVCPLRAGGLVGLCEQKLTGFSGSARKNHASVAYNGYIYVIGGTNGTIQSDIIRIQTPSSLDGSRYERTIDLSLSTNKVTGFVINGASNCAYSVNYGVAGVTSSNVYNYTNLPNVVPGLTYTLSGVTDAKYIYFVIVLDDSTCGPQSTITDIVVTYNGLTSAPVLSSPENSSMNVSLTPTFSMSSSDADNDYLRYKIEVCTTSNCSSILRTIDQTLSQVGWISQSQQTGTAYSGGSPNTQYAIHQYQPTALTANTQYWWRAYAIDPGGSNQWSAASSTWSFTTGAVATGNTNIGGGTTFYGGTTVVTGN